MVITPNMPIYTAQHFPTSCALLFCLLTSWVRALSCCWNTLSQYQTHASYTAAILPRNFILPEVKQHIVPKCHCKEIWLCYASFPHIRCQRSSKITLLQMTCLKVLSCWFIFLFNQKRKISFYKELWTGVVDRLRLINQNCVCIKPWTLYHLSCQMLSWLYPKAS